MVGMPNRDFWKDRRVLITGVTGFKGGWFALWLEHLGAKVFGYSLSPPTDPCMFYVAKVIGKLTAVAEADTRNIENLMAAIVAWQPEVVIHLAALPIVLDSYKKPLEFITTNVMGTVNLLEACRSSNSIKAIVVVTSDKVYENTGAPFAYRETDPLGGHDPYSASKACVEILTKAYARSFFQEELGIATARAGNVVGGGDWAPYRLLPDAARALSKGEAVKIRNPGSIRPWQHVLEPLRGYLLLAEALFIRPIIFREANQSWNFGPDQGSIRSVGEVVEKVCRWWGEGARWEGGDPIHFHEDHSLTLDASKARALGWRPVLDLEQTVRWTVEWYKSFHANKGMLMQSFTLEQITKYEELCGS
jgi:CDP-glucose 4,6-dehydratase